MKKYCRVYYHMECKKSKTISFAVDTRLFTPIYSVDDGDSLQSDLQCVYDWARSNNMVFNSGKFNNLCFSASSDMSVYSNAYISPEMNLIAQHGHIKDLGVFMSAGCSFDHHISVISKKCSSIAGWIVRTLPVEIELQCLPGFRYQKEPKTVVSFPFTKLSTIWLLYHIHLWKRLMCIPGKIILKSSATSVTTLNHMNNRFFLTVLVHGMALLKTLQRPTL